MSESNTLTDIKGTLDDIKAILLLINQDKIADLKRNLIKEGSIELQVYELCNGESTTEDIGNILKKSPANMRAVISSLRQKGLVKTVAIEGKKIHQQVI